MKIVDPHGDMLSLEWENVATEIVNVPANLLEDKIKEIIQKYLFKDLTRFESTRIIVGMDTRPSSSHLASLAIKGAMEYWPSCVILNAGVATTPQLHFLTVRANDAIPSGDFSTATSVWTYTKFMVDAFKAFFSKSNPPKLEGLVLDAANGVGTFAARDFLALLSDDSTFSPRNPYLNIYLTNKGEGILNFECGADYVKMFQRSPKSIQMKTGLRYASFDGDADRLVYYYLKPCVQRSIAAPEPVVFRLLDGDKIATLMAVFIQSHIQNSGVKASIGVVQTAYANGATTKYITDQLV